MGTLKIPIKGMHCRSCEITLTDCLEEVSGISKAKVSLKDRSATVYGSNLPNIVDLEPVIQAAGYTVGYDKQPWLSKNGADYKDAVIGVVVVGFLALLISRLGLGDISTGNLVSGGAMVAFIVGLTAGFSTCMALIGGLVLGLSAKHAKAHPTASSFQKFRPHLYFNASRIMSFVVFGGLIGAVGAAFQLRGPMLGGLMIGVGVVMLILGLQLTNIFPRLSNGGLTIPPQLARRLGFNRKSSKEYSHAHASWLGVVSFFLPCGFTQAMQIYAISTGSFTTGALVMGLFALGTTPGLLGVGGLTSIVEGPAAKRFFKITGVAVVAMALLNISNGYTLTGWPKPLARTSSIEQPTPPEFYPTVLTGEVSEPGAMTDVVPTDNKIEASYSLASGMVPTSFTVKANEPYVFEMTPLEDGAGCMSTVLIPGLNHDVQYLFKGEVNRLPFKATRPGVYPITCAMGVPFGEITVI